MGIVVGGYARISDVGELGDGRDGEEGVTRQKDDVHDLVKGRHLTLHRMYVDNDLSAYKRRVVRPDFRELVSDLETSVISGIAAYNIDRITRQPRELEQLIDIYATARRPMVFATTAGDYDLSTDDGRFNARLYVMIANKFSADAARRVARQKKAEAMQGKPHKGRRPFGWQDGGEKVEAFEAELIRKAQRDVLNGKLLSEVHAEWVELGISSPQSAPGETISFSSVEYIITNPRLCGYRAYVPQAERERRGRIDLGEWLLERTDGTPIIGTWETICTPDEWRAVRDVLKSRKSEGRGRKKGSTVSKRKLTRIGRCGECGHGVQSGNYARGTTSYEKYGYYYYCRKADGGCGGVSRSGPPVEEHVERVLLAHLMNLAKDSRPGEALDDPELIKARAELAQVEADMIEARQLREAGEFPLGEFVREIKRLETKQNELSVKVAGLNAMGPQTGASAAERIIREWKTYTAPMKRAVIQRFIEAVVIKKQPRGGNHAFRPDLIEIIWKK
ncbi:MULTISPECIES: recombinase family protein [Streptomyces]|uniref:recombinase family protein n=1 Tax=Streptomyces TaxID=1883 RepID=UPI0022AED4BA|nr:recombinase family protein [Streptomyces sp. H34-S5]MCZ4085476.1 recombinase family protein [Streptomyces sp. H34-S5]